MNDLERALLRTLAGILTSERMPDGRQLTDEEWWATVHIADILVDGPIAEVTWPNRAAHVGPPAESYPQARPAPGPQ